MTYKTHKEIHSELMRDEEYRAAYEAEERKEHLQALLLEQSVPRASGDKLSAETQDVRQQRKGRKVTRPPRRAV